MLIIYYLSYFLLYFSVTDSMINYSKPSTHLNFMLQQPQPLNQYPQYSYMQSNNMFLNCHPGYQPTFVCASLPPPLNQSSTSQLQQDNNIVFDKRESKILEQSDDQSPAKQLTKFAETNVIKLINDSLSKHCYSSDKNADLEIGNAKKLKLRTVQSGADLLARTKIISNSYTNQPSKLIKIQQHLSQSKNKTKLKIAPLSDIVLTSICNKNKTIKFINEQAGVISNTINEELMPTSKTVLLSRKNPFANSILMSLLKKAKLEKESFGFKKFVLPNLNSVCNTVDCLESDKEIKLYKNMKPKMIKKAVGYVKTKNGFKSVIKQYWGIKHQGLKKKHDKIPATKHNMIRKGNVHKLALKNGLVKSALKNKNNLNGNDCSKKPKEKRVTFLIEGETLPISPNSEIRPINLNQNIVKQKPLMKCHPFEVRNKPKSILQSSIVQGDSSQFSHEQSSEITNNHIILPIVKKFKASRNRRASLRDKTLYLEQLRNQRKNMIPESMMSLSVDVLKLIPDNKKEMKKVIDYYHLMATIIVKNLGSYTKKTCQQGRIRSDEDFKFLAKKVIN